MEKQGIRSRGAGWMIFGLILIFSLVMLVLGMMYRVSTIEVVNASEYSDEQIIAASGIETGSNLFFVDRFSAASLIFSELKYMETISIRRQLPDKIIIQAEGTAASAWMEINDSSWVMDRKGRLLEETTEAAVGGYIEVRGITAVSPLVGQDIIPGSSADGERLAYVTDLLTALVAEDLTGIVDWIDLSDTGNARLRYDGRLDVYLGDHTDTLRRVAMMKDAISRMSAGDTGALRYSEQNIWQYSPD